jgi:Protein of unknown function (DUF2905)
MNTQISKYLIIAGVIILLIGVLFYFFGEKLNWIGRLPGDIRVEKPNFKFYFPITTMLLLSGLLNLVIWIIKKIFH